jgi:hypothetical protein
MRFEVPQFVDVEDKIFGPFTWKQFVYLAGGAGAAFIIYISLPFFFFVLFGGPLIALSLGLAFYKVNNRPLSYMIEAVFTYFASGKQYRWRKEQVPDAAEAAPKQAPDFSVISHNNLSSMSRALEVKAMHGEKRP